jgi:N-acyl-D-aspartate/D-glutamate deacylase
MKSKMNTLLSVLVIFYLWPSGTACKSGPAEHYDILITKTRIVDGTGSDAYTGDIAIRGEKIVAIGKVNGDADTVINGTGLVASPGFIDLHTHADNNILDYPEAENFIMQGITTVVGGNCGGSPAPRKDLTFSKWLSKVEETGISLNLAQLVGHVAVRVQVMGRDFKREATAEEVNQMKPYIEEAMQNGAFGMSTMLDPPTPGEFASVEDELIPLAKIVGEYGGGFWPHQRHHRSHWGSDDPQEVGYGIFHGPLEDAFVGTYRGLMEVIDISRKADLPLHIAHLVNVYRIPQPHPDFLDEAVAEATLWLIDNAIEEGLDITFDVTFALAGVARRNYLLRDFWRSRNIALSWLNKLDKDDVVEMVKTDDFRDKVKVVYDKGRLKLGMIQTKADPYWMNRFKILICESKEYEGKTIGEIAQLEEKDPLDTVLDILAADPETIWVQHMDERYFEAAIPALLKHPNASPNTDWACAPAIDSPEGRFEGKDMWYTSSPIGYGLYADYIGTLVREKKLFTLEEAINRATYGPASMVLGLDDRGILAPGAYADVLVFDLNRISMTGDFLKPARRPEGIEYVIVNGQIVYKDNTHTGARPGKVLRHRPKK